MADFKFYMAAENKRNAASTAMFQRFFRKAFGDEHEIVLVGHHFMIEPQTGNPEEDLRHMNEVPSADTAIFDHPLMTAVFGEYAIKIMAHLATVPTEGGERDKLLESYLNARLAVKATACPRSFNLEKASWKDDVEELGKQPTYQHPVAA
jgi:hypothetical protein